MKKAEEIGFTSLLVIIFAVFVILGWGYADQVRIVPLALSIPGLALSVLHLGSLIVKAQRTKKEEKSDTHSQSVDKTTDAHKPFLSTQTRKILEIWTWIIALALGIHFLGFLIALPIFLITFIKFFAERTWKLGVLISASFTLVVYLVFYVALKATL